MLNPSTPIRSRLISRRKHLRLTQQQVADAAGVNVKTITRYERGSGLSLAHLVAICSALGSRVEIVYDEVEITSE